MRVVTGQEMLAIDRHSIAAGMPRAALMEMAGNAVAQTAVQMCGSVNGKVIDIYCGLGNNGGDGFVAARHLMNAGAQVRVLLAGSPERLTAEAAQFYQLLVQAGCNITVVGSTETQPSAAPAHLAIDALLGTGAHGAPREPIASIIKQINALHCPVLAVDIPSGVESDTGRVPGTAVQATRTVTFGLYKLGLLLYPGAAYVGQLSLTNIGFSLAHLSWREEVWPERIRLCRRVVTLWRQPRRRDTHKGTYGKVLVVAGSQGMLGAGYLATMATLRVGAGLVTWAGPNSLWNVMAQKVTEATTLGLPESSAIGICGLDAAALVADWLADGSILAIGPGLGRHPETGEFVRRVLGVAQNPMVIDADALYALAAAGDGRGQTHPGWVLTPHPGEAARLLGCSIADIEKDRIAALDLLVRNYQCTVVLKGVPTLVKSPNGPLYINSSGNPGMASGGSGDVLTGVIAGLLAQGFTPPLAAAAGVYLHGFAGDLAAQRGEAGLVAGDLLQALPEALAAVWEREDEQV